MFSVVRSQDQVIIKILLSIACMQGINPSFFIFLFYSGNVLNRWPLQPSKGRAVPGCC